MVAFSFVRALSFFVEGRAVRVCNEGRACVRVCVFVGGGSVCDGLAWKGVDSFRAKQQKDSSSSLAPPPTCPILCPY